MLPRTTQTALAQLIGVKPSTISKIESGERRRAPNSHFVRVIAEALKCSGSYLMGMRDDPVIPVFLNGRQAELLRYFDQLDERGQAAIIDVVRDSLATISHHRKSSADSS